MKLDKIKNPNKLNVRDFITLAIIIVLHFVLFTASTPLGMTVVGNLFVYAFCGVLWGSIFLLLCTKVNKPWIVFFYGIVIALMQLMNFWGSSFFIALGSIIAEIIWHKLDRKKFSTMVISYIVLITFMYFGLSVPLIFIKDLYLAALPAYVDLYTAVYELAASYMFFVGLIATIIGCIIGAFIGKLLLKKHFIKSGIV